ncbi:TetR family transcriptional regulator [Streptomyces pseudogriseolus]|uniref:TetR/AcrR family transcriptional regulator n=1 Tax=Streptomyces pseudogriseolus TaxID=36817 RepID=UPI003FA200DC
MLQTGSRVSTRESIHSAAARLFRTSGCARTTVRRIAAEAGTDPALVIRHFRSKELLFLETMHMTLDLGPLFDAPLDRLGERLAELLLDLGGSARGVFLALVHGGDEPHIRDRLRDTHEHLFVEPLRRRLTGPDADLRANGGRRSGRTPLRPVGRRGPCSAPPGPHGTGVAVRRPAPGGADSPGLPGFPSPLDGPLYLPGSRLDRFLSPRRPAVAAGRSGPIPRRGPPPSAPGRAENSGASAPGSCEHAWP